MGPAAAAAAAAAVAILLVQTKKNWPCPYQGVQECEAGNCKENPGTRDSDQRGSQ